MTPMDGTAANCKEKNMSWFSNWWASVTKPIPTLGKLGNLFNDYQAAYLSASKPTEEFLEIYVPAHKIMLFGSQTAKQAYHDALAKRYGWASGEVSWENVSSVVPEIIGDLRTRNGKMVINTLCLGHEYQHTIARLDGRVLDPDKYAQIK